MSAPYLHGHMPIAWIVMSLCGRSIGLTVMHNMQDHPRSRHVTLVSLVGPQFGQFGSTKTAGEQVWWLSGWSETSNFWS